MKPHVFVAMPFGQKDDSRGGKIDFDKVYQNYIEPALVAANVEVICAEREQRAGDIRKDMFQELVLADLVVADLTINHPNVWYEIGVRHALRARGVVIVCGGKITTAFDLQSEHKLRYQLVKGVTHPDISEPNPDTLNEDIVALTQMVKETLESWKGRKISPVFNLMPHLQEPDWKSLRVGDAREYWKNHDRWENRLELARKSKPPLVGDILVLSEEAPVAAFQADAWIQAGVALLNTKQYDFALEQLQRGLDIEPDCLNALQKKGICLQKLAQKKWKNYSIDRVKKHYQKMLKTYPNDSETWALLARVDKDVWIESWSEPNLSINERRAKAAEEDALLRSAIESYYQGYSREPKYYYSGISALTLMHLFQDLTAEADYEDRMDMLQGAVRFSATCETNAARLYWAKVTLGDLEVLVGTPQTVKRAYSDAIANNGKNWFNLDSARSQLQLLKTLGFRPDNVDAGIETLSRAINRLTKPEERWEPKQVFLFSGHMVDEQDRKTPRFPNEKAAIAFRKIEEALVEMGAGPNDLALTQGACGGDLIFTEACQKLGVKVQWMQPFDEPEFIQRSVDRGGPEWRDRYFAAKEKLDIEKLPIRSAPQSLGSTPPRFGAYYSYERCNLWLLFTTLSFGTEKVRFICLWNGEGGDGPGGTAHMYNEVKDRTGMVKWVDTNSL
ncbi:MAG: tetratricopeptide repeat-containing protein [Synechococcus sp.]